jgi:hypothetical protein
MDNDWIAHLGAIIPKLPNFAQNGQPDFFTKAVEQMHTAIAAATERLTDKPFTSRPNSRKQSTNNTKGPSAASLDDPCVVASASLFLQQAECNTTTTSNDDYTDHLNPHYQQDLNLFSTIPENNNNKNQTLDNNNRRRRSPPPPSSSTTTTTAKKKKKKQQKQNNNKTHSPTHFPCLLTENQHQLLATGKKIWGAGFFLPLAEIYSFAVYINTEQASKLLETYVDSKTANTANKNKAPPQILDTVKSSPGVELSLVVQISRNLPLGIMTGEYERILKRRLKAAGADPNDPALTSVITAFRKSLPERLLTKRGGFLKKGTKLVFTKEDGGRRLTANAGGEVLRSVESRQLCSAVFDLYVGSNPVSKEAVVQAVESLESLAVEKEGFRSKVGCVV